MHWGSPNNIVWLLMPIILFYASNHFGGRLQGMSYLMRPANTIEKWIANLSLVHLYYTAIFVLACVLGHCTGKFLYQFHQNNTLDLTSDLGGLSIYNCWLRAFVIQSMFIFAAIYFRKKAFLKTLLFLGVSFLVVLISILIFFRLANNVEAIGMLVGALGEQELGYIVSYTIDKYVWISRVLVHATIPFFWGLTYFRLKETEV
jgi:F0F1-type ATP synthase assembly protein I